MRSFQLPSYVSILIYQLTSRAVLTIWDITLMKNPFNYFEGATEAVKVALKILS